MDFDADPAQRFEHRGTSASIWRPSHGVVVTRIEGPGTAAVTKFYIAFAQRAIVECGSIRVFHDWSRMSTYDPEARDLIRAFGKTNDDARVLVRYLVDSKILSMAIQTAALVLNRDFESTTDPKAFVRWIDAAIATTPRSRPTLRPGRPT